jgi:hypothetical protein
MHHHCCHQGTLSPHLLLPSLPCRHHHPAKEPAVAAHVPAGGGYRQEGLPLTTSAWLACRLIYPYMICALIQSVVGASIVPLVLSPQVGEVGFCLAVRNVRLVCCACIVRMSACSAALRCCSDVIATRAMQYSMLPMLFWSTPDCCKPCATGPMHAMGLPAHSSPASYLDLL